MKNKKNILIICLIIILLIFYILSSGSKDKLSLGTLVGTDFTNIEVRDGNTGTLIILDIEKIDELYEKLKDIEIVRDKSSKDHTGWNYAIKFLYGSKEVDEILILGSNKIIYHNYFYDLNSNIDIEYLKSLF